jgi:signal transduction histidine kinase/DNA-binding response OmpR family regulator/ligand-binding sensor domain-containing protein
MSYFSRAATVLIGALATVLTINITSAQMPTPVDLLVKPNFLPGNQEPGFPFLRNYSPKEYNASDQNWAVLQDNRGVMYFGNGWGVITYNGVSWKLIETPNRTVIRSLAMDKAGRIYVGGAADIGYLERNKDGKQVFHSLLAHLKKEDQDFASVWKTHATPQGVYFQSEQSIFRWQNNRFKVWKPEGAFYKSYLVGSQFYVHHKDKGLMEMHNETLRLVSQGEKLADMKVETLLPLDKDRILIGTRKDGLFIYDGLSITPFPAEVNEFLTNNHLYQGALLADGTIAMATLRGGLLIMDKQGKLVQLVNKAKGLASNSVYDFTVDRQGAFWLALQKGMSRVELHSPFSAFREAAGLEGAISAITRHKGSIHVTTTLGVFKLEMPSVAQALAGEPPRFKALPGIAENCWGILSVGEDLLVSTNNGICQIKNEKITWFNHERSSYLFRSRKHPDRVFVSLEEGVAVLKWENNEWKQEGKLAGVHEEIHSITETKDGRLWLSTFYQGMSCVTFPTDTKTNLVTNYLSPSVEKLGAQQGLPPGYVKACVINDEVWARLSDDDKVYSYDKAKHRFQFISNTDFGRKFGLINREANPIMSQTSTGAIWLISKGQNERHWKRTIAIPQDGGTYQIKSFGLERITEGTGPSTYPDQDSLVWYGGSDGLIRHDLKLHKKDNGNFQTLLERMVVNRDSMVYPTVANLSFDDKHSSLRFEFGAPSYDNEKDNEFQSQLEGYDEDWSAWSKEPFQEYSRIPSGNYTLQVRARNIYGQVGQKATYAFTILPPWYQTWPVYLFYLLLLAGLIYLIVRWRSAQLRAEKLALEVIVQDRTSEIAVKNQQLQQQAGQLLEMDRMKSNFFANLSHEFRTPLTLILGTVNDAYAQVSGQPEAGAVPIRKKEVGMMRRNAQRLLQLINQLLDLSKVESGQMKIRLQNGDLNQLLRVIAASFSSLAEIRHIHFQTVLPEQPLICQLDVDQVEKICYNLLSNAFKFTPNGGTITLEAQLLTLASSPIVQIMVQDTGTGIPVNQLDKVFERFYQGSTSYQGDQQGTGIGLALAKELVQLQGGKVWVESQPEQGARFVVQLPFFEPILDQPVVSDFNEAALLSQAIITPLPSSRESKEPELTSSVGAMATSTLVEENESLPILLIVEDNEDLRAYIRGHLEENYRVLESENGLRGWETALSALPDLIISDWMMPEMSGIDLCHRIKSDERTSHIPFILLTALATREGKLTGLETGADDYLTKPFDAHELNVRVRNLIDNRRKLRERFGRELRIQPSDITVTSADEKFLQRVMKIVEDNMGDSEFSAELFGREAGLSRMQLHRKLTALTGQSASDFIRMMRLKRAAQLFEAQSATVSEIAYEVGFNNLSYFAKCFREQFGILPHDYIARQAIP